MNLYSNIFVSAITGFISGLVFAAVSNTLKFFSEEHNGNFDFLLFAKSLAFSSTSISCLFVLIAFVVTSLGLIPESQINRFIIGQGVLLALVGVILRAWNFFYTARVSQSSDDNQTE
jgi:hypothetical protein